VIIMAQPAPVELMNNLIARTAVDSGLRQRLLEDPVRTLQAEGISVPAGMEVKVLEHSDAVFYLPLPEHSSKLSDAVLDEVAAGVVYDNRASADLSVEALKTAWSRLF
jgi:hypothetical protein